MLGGDGQRKLEQLVGRIRELAGGRAVGGVTKSLAAEAMTRLKSGFDKSQSPYGERWADVARGGMPLQDTRRLRNAFQDASTPGRVVLTNPTIYARLMNEGGVVKAKNAPYLTFPMRIAGSARVIRGGQVVKRGRGSTQWVRVKQVTIQRRQFLPDNRGLPVEWAVRFELVAKTYLAKQVLRAA